jgi:nucleotidyltransferase/DNA polymerase involved in DNA repair
MTQKQLGTAKLLDSEKELTVKNLKTIYEKQKRNEELLMGKLDAEGLLLREQKDHGLTTSQMTEFRMKNKSLEKAKTELEVIFNLVD